MYVPSWLSVDFGHLAHQQSWKVDILYSLQGYGPPARGYGVIYGPPVNRQAAPVGYIDPPGYYLPVHFLRPRQGNAPLGCVRMPAPPQCRGFPCRCESDELTSCDY